MTWGNMLEITPVPFISLLLWIVMTVLVLYLARGSAHKVIRMLCEAVHDAFSLAAQATASAEQKLGQRNREVLLAAGQEAKERIIEREFDRVGDSVHRDLAGYPGLQRTLSDAITRIEEDHQRAVDVPPDPPGWIKAVDAVAKIPGGKDAMVGDILSDIHKSLVRAHEGAMNQYRDASRKRHELLRRMMPHWRRIQLTLGKVNKSIESLLQRSRSIDRHMSEYQEISSGTDRAVSVLSSSSMVQFFISGLVLTIAVGGAAINFSLIARPMAEMVGGTSFIGDFQTADIAALVIILVEISMGLFLMESLRITRLFPVIGALPDKMRRRMIFTTFTILFLLASVEAGLAYMREILMQDELATTALLRGGETLLASDYVWITTAAQMGMGFTLPFALVFVALPLEAFVHSSRTVLGMLGMGLLKLLQLTLSLVAGLFTKAGEVLVRVYDIPIFMPLWIETMRLKPPGDDERRLGVSS